MNKTNTPLSQIHQTLTTANSIVILPHLKPDGDTLGSSIALCRYLRSIGKQVHIYSLDPVPANLTFLDTTAFVSTAPPSVDLVVAIDSSDELRLVPRLQEFSVPVLNIDHHRTNGYYGDQNYVTKQSSTGEIIYQLLKAWKAPFDEETMIALYTAIATDTNRFYYDSTTAETLLAVADLMGRGLKITPVNNLIYGQTPLEKKQLQGYALSQAKRLAGGKLIVSEVSWATQEAFHCFDTDDIVESLRDIQGVEVAVLAYEYAGVWKISLRSKSGFDVGTIAYDFGGGGHIGAAGISLAPSAYPDVRERLLQRIEDQLAIG